MIIILTDKIANLHNDSEPYALEISEDGSGIRKVKLKNGIVKEVYIDKDGWIVSLYTFSNWLL